MDRFLARYRALCEREEQKGQQRGTPRRGDGAKETSGAGQRRGQQSKGQKGSEQTQPNASLLAGLSRGKLVVTIPGKAAEQAEIIRRLLSGPGPAPLHTVTVAAGAKRKGKKAASRAPSGKESATGCFIARGVAHALAAGAPLHSLSLTGFALRRSEVTALAAAIKTGHRMRALDLSRTELGDAALWARGPTVLNLTSCALTDGAAPALANLIAGQYRARCELLWADALRDTTTPDPSQSDALPHGVVRLHLAGNALTDRGAAALATQLARDAFVLELDLTRNAIALPDALALARIVRERDSPLRVLIEEQEGQPTAAERAAGQARTRAEQPGAGAGAKAAPAAVTSVRITRLGERRAAAGAGHVGKVQATKPPSLSETDAMASLARLAARERRADVEELLHKWGLGAPVASAEDRATEAVHRASVRSLDATHASVPPAPAAIEASMGRVGRFANEFRER